MHYTYANTKDRSSNARQGQSTRARLGSVVFTVYCLTFCHLWLKRTHKTLLLWTL